MQNQTNAKHSSNSEETFKSAKTVLEKHNIKEDSTNTTTSKVLRTFIVLILLLDG